MPGERPAHEPHAGREAFSLDHICSILDDYCDTKKQAKIQKLDLSLK
jgi:hypothetical protein